MEIEWTRCTELLISLLLDDLPRYKIEGLIRVNQRYFSSSFRTKGVIFELQNYLFNRLSYRLIQRMYGHVCTYVLISRLLMIQTRQHYQHPPFLLLC